MTRRRVTPMRKGEHFWLVVLWVLLITAAVCLVVLFAANGYTLHHKHRAFTLTLLAVMFTSLGLAAPVAVMGLIRYGTIEVADE